MAFFPTSLAGFDTGPLLDMTQMKLRFYKLIDCEFYFFKYFNKSYRIAILITLACDSDLEQNVRKVAYQRKLVWVVK